MFSGRDESNVSRYLENLANLGIVVVAVCVILTVVRGTRTPTYNSNLLPTIKVGDTLTIPRTVRDRHAYRLVLALSTTCRFCIESGPFYQRLSAASVREHFPADIVAIFSQPAIEGRQYLDQLRIDIQDVQNADFDGLKIASTPTLMLIDEKGAVKHLWIGKLTPKEEDEVLSVMRKLAL